MGSKKAPWGSWGGLKRVLQVPTVPRIVLLVEEEQRIAVLQAGFPAKTENSFSSSWISRRNRKFLLLWVGFPARIENSCSLT